MNYGKLREQKMVIRLMAALLAACVLAAASPTAAQRPRETRIAVVGAPEEPRFSEIVAGLKKGLGEAGYLPPSLMVEEIRIARAEEKNLKPTVEKALQRGAQVLFLIGSRLLKPVREIIDGSAGCFHHAR